MDVVDPNLFLAFREDVRRKRKKRRRAYEFTAGQHRGSLTRQLDFSQTNYLAFGDDFITEIRFHVSQIIVIEKSNHAPRPYKLSKFTSCSSPEERLAATA